MRSQRTPSRIGRPAGSRSHGLTTGALAVVAVVIGLAVGRFVSGPEMSPRSPADAATAIPISAPPAQRVAALERAVGERSDDLAALQQLGVAYVQRAAEVGDPAFYDLAEQSFDRADLVAPDRPETLLGRATLALSLHKFEEARALGMRVRAQLPDSAEPLGVLVDAEVELGGYEAAAGWVDEMLDVDPGTAALSRVSYLRELHGDLDGAVTAMRQAATAAGVGSFEQASVLSLIGDLHWALGDVAGASASYRAALEVAADLPSAQIGTARVLAAEGDTQHAIERLKELTARIPQPAALLLLLDLQVMTGDEAGAAGTRDLARAVSDLQREAGQDVDLELALLEADHGDPHAALELARTAHAARPDNVHALHALAWALVRTGDAQAARPLIAQALRLGTEDPMVRYHAAVVLDAAGAPDDARASLRVALAGNPWFTFGGRPEVAALAERLDVPTPSAWAR